MIDNLKTTKYNDGTLITLVTDSIAWSTLVTGGCCWYGNNSSNGDPYGALYNWYAVNTGKLAPTGWHVPTDSDWTSLTTFLGGESVAGDSLKEAGTAHWLPPNTGATNSTGFNALPGGNRRDNGAFYVIGYSGFWWSSTASNATHAWTRSMYCNGANVYRTNFNENTYGFSVRCVKNR